MTEDLSKTPQFNLLHRLRAYFNVPTDLALEIERRLNQGRWAADELEVAKRRIEYLKQHVPPEIANPPQRETCRPRFTGD